MPLPRVLTAALLACTVALPAAAEMTQAERDDLRKEIRAYLLENPEVLVEAMNELQAREEQAAASRDQQLLKDHADAIFNDANSWVGGNPEGDITVVEFMDYRCGYCRKAYEEVEELVKSDGNIRYVVKEFPILGDQSVLSSQFAIAVRQLHGDEAYRQAFDGLISLKGEANEDSLTALAGKLGLDAAPILDRMDDPEVMAVIAANHELATILDISGTPTFIVDQTMVRGYVPLDGMRQIVAGERQG